jgi:coenzyme PQQ precursor peptide PqqA
MTWTTPTICEVSIGMEVTSYASAKKKPSLFPQLGDGKLGRLSLLRGRSFLCGCDHSA